MEALLGNYGSDDSCSSSSDATIANTDQFLPSCTSNPSSSSPPPPPSIPSSTTKIPDKKSNEEKKKSSSLTGLLVAYSNVDKNQNEKGCEDMVNLNTTGKIADRNISITKRVHSGDTSKDKTQSTTETTKRRRRRRRWDNAEGTIASSDRNDMQETSELEADTPTILPPPRLAGEGDKPFDALILFPKDYVTPFSRRCRHRHRQRSGGPLNGGNNGKNVSTLPAGGNSEEMDKSAGIRPGLAEKLDAMYQKFYQKTTMTTTNSSNNDGNIHGGSGSNGNSFAIHLKSQKEFGNPHLFPSIIQHFGIDPMGSNIPKSLWDPKKDFARFEYVERIVAKEEENRLRGRS